MNRSIFPLLLCMFLAHRFDAVYCRLPNIMHGPFVKSRTCLVSYKKVYDGPSGRAPYWDFYDIEDVKEKRQLYKLSSKEAIWLTHFLLSSHWLTDRNDYNWPLYDFLQNGDTRWSKMFKKKPDSNDDFIFFVIEYMICSGMHDLAKCFKNKNNVIFKLCDEFYLLTEQEKKEIREKFLGKINNLS